MEEIKKNENEDQKKKKDINPINERIAHYRKKAGYTQEQVAQLLGIPSQTYSYRELKGKVSGEFVNALARLFGVPAVWILDGESKEEAIAPPSPIQKPIEVKQPPVAEPPAEPQIKSTGEYIANLYDHLPRDLQFEVFDFVTNAFHRAKDRENNV